MTILTIPVNYDGVIYQIGDDYTKSDDISLMQVGGVYDTKLLMWSRYRDYLRFSLTDLPADLTVDQITQVRLYLYCHIISISLNHLTDIHAYNTNGQTDPSADTGVTLYNRCASGNLYVDDSTALREVGGHKWFVLGGNIKQDILDAKAAVNRIALALHEEADDDSIAELSTLEMPPPYNYPAQLEITYETAAPPTKISVTGSVSGLGSLLRDKELTVSGSVGASGVLLRGKAFTITGSTIILGSAKTDKQLTVNGNIIASGTLLTSKSFTVQGTIDATGLVTIKETFKQLTVLGNIIAQGSITINKIIAPPILPEVPKGGYMVARKPSCESLIIDLADGEVYFDFGDIFVSIEGHILVNLNKTKPIYMRIN